MRIWYLIYKLALFLIALFLLVLFLVSPLVVQLHMEPFYQFAKSITPGDRGNWLQFWGSYFGFIPTGLVTFLVLEFQFRRQDKIDERNDNRQLKRQKNQFLFEREYDALESRIKIVDGMTKEFLIMLNSFSRYDIKTDEFSKDIYIGFQNGLYALSQQNMALETWAEGYFENEESAEINLINELKVTIGALNRQKDGIQRKNYFNEHPDEIVIDFYRRFVPDEVEQLSRSGKETTEQLRLELFKRLQTLKRNL